MTPTEKAKLTIEIRQLQQHIKDIESCKVPGQRYWYYQGDLYSPWKVRMLQTELEKLTAKRNQL